MQFVKLKINVYYFVLLTRVVLAIIYDTDQCCIFCSDFGTEVSPLNKSLNVRKNFALTYYNVRIKSRLVSKKKLKWREKFSV
jgi:hypothetical protein